ncbi:uncharacterized protein [Littorina saxatilis]
MRSMDRSKHPDFNCGPTTGRRARPRSPAYDHYDTHTRQRQRQSDANTEEIIQFVRGYQLERETTFLRLQKKAVLPGIGQMSCSMDDPGLSSGHLGRHDSRADDGDEDDDDDEDEDEGLADEDVLVDSEVAAIDAAHRDPLRHTSLGHDPRYGGREGHRFDRCPKPSASYGPPASNHRQAFRPLDNHGHAGGRAHAGRSLGRSLNQLPPIARDELPDRPSAPSPSLTPPGEDEELDSAGEPIDFIDAF